MIRSLRIALAAAPVALLASCSSGSSAPAETLPAQVDLQVNAVASLKFDKADYGTVKAGDLVIGYSNQDSVRHTLIIAKDDVKVPNFKLVIEEKGSNDSGTVNLEAGTYVLICDVPGHSNMKATLTVEP
ncbi:MAG: Copper binding protein plastocyanin/azurin family [Actinomycetota bacterium]|jgi:plastocyanin